MYSCRVQAGGLGRVRQRISRRFQPKSRASTDHLPGPTSAVAVATVPAKAQYQRSAGYVYASATAVSANKLPATGVHSPMMINAPRPI